MKIKTIEKVIAKKFHDFLDSIKDEEVKSLIKQNTIITGGCITSMLLKEKVNDYDLYFRDIKTVYKVSEYYLKEMQEIYPNSKISKAEIKILERDGDYKWKDLSEGISLEEVFEYVPDSSEDVKYRVTIFIRSDGVFGEQTSGYDSYEQEELNETNLLEEIEELKEEEENKKGKYYPTYISENAITLSHKIQIVSRFYGDPETIIANYDFVHVTNTWSSEDFKVKTNTRALEAIIAKELCYIGSRHPLASIFRIRKFIRRGWQVNAGQIIKMAYQLNDMDLNDIDILRSQLTGVDVAYMHQLLYKLGKMKEEQPDLDIKCYFLDLVSKIFD